VAGGNGRKYPINKLGELCRCKKGMRDLLHTWERQPDKVICLEWQWTYDGYVQKQRNKNEI